MRKVDVAFPQVEGPIAQLVERLAGSQEVRGSNPLGSTTPDHGNRNAQGDGFPRGLALVA